MSISDEDIARIEAAAKELSFGLRESIMKEDAIRVVSAMLQPSRILAIIERLRVAEAVLAKLPLTADGVPVVPGMEVWIDGYKQIVHVRAGGDPGKWFPVERCFSSGDACLKAALAAQGKVQS